MSSIRSSPVNATVPLWASLFEWLIWNEVPDLITYIGAAIIAVSGILSVAQAKGSD
jgi:drug/metabolite transporter (DMT)-like permease